MKKNQLISPERCAQWISEGRTLIVAADAALLQQLPKGNWIGGSIPYFMSEEGGALLRDQVFVTDLTTEIENFSIKAYRAEDLEQMLADRPVNGFCYLLMPAFQDVQATYALEISQNISLFDVPTLGWVTGVAWGEATAPIVVNGQDGTVYLDQLVALHAHLPAEKYAELSIVNIYEQNEGPDIQFLQDGYQAEYCLIDGERQNFLSYLQTHQIDLDYPLVGDFAGAELNTSIYQAEEGAQAVNFASPVFQSQTYRFAKNIADRQASFRSKLPPKTESTLLAYNCVANFLQLSQNENYTKDYTYPFTFGEIAYLVLNQTMVILDIKQL
ncbi:hypothetical protein PPO43_04655 [Saprospira sp. CCB-QB6]|uniref:DUF6976 family protein n=1 Tax=Saprospira sp. CCB-QB6 TaxID=3023936 RepID=UPI00234A9D07|nr:hypothetical protein [Saprospira sp. CCB-QB6]WCL82389.1 hypothetical protein PPO43_04655 [Saprospira sp. CCB-QB6]